MIIFVINLFNSSACGTSETTVGESDPNSFQNSVGSGTGKTHSVMLSMTISTYLMKIIIF